MVVNEEESSVGKRKNSDLKKFDHYIIFLHKNFMLSLLCKSDLCSKTSN